MDGAQGPLDNAPAKLKKRIVIVGAGGRLGGALLRAYARHYEVTGFNRAQLDLVNSDGLRETLGGMEFDLLINCAAETNVDRCEKEPEEAFRLNAEAPAILAKICQQQNAKLVHVSTDYVFDGRKSEPYGEEDEALPVSVYGRSKLEGEQRILEASPRHLVIRVSWVFGPERPSFIDWVIKEAREREQVAAIADKFSTPTYTVDIAHMLQLLLDREAQGIFHVTSRGQCSWHEYGQWALDCCRRNGIQLRTQTVDALLLSDMKQFIARRPVSSVLSTEKFARATGRTPRPWQEAVSDYVRDFIVSAAPV